MLIYTNDDPDLPSETHRIAAARVRAIFDGRTPVKTLRIARAMCRSEEQALVDLRRAERAGLIVRCGEAWVPVQR
jgi:hypothetical protein